MPGHKAGAAPAPASRPRKRRARGFGRRRAAPTVRVEHAYARCPTCDGPLAGRTVKRAREVIEVVPAPAAVTEHAYLERRCPVCRGRWVPAPGLAGEVVGRGRLGVGLLSLIATLREVGRWPVATIQWYLATVHRVRLSAGAIVAASASVAARAAPVVEEVRAAIRASPVVHADETGWRENGRNGYVWTFSTPTERLFIHGGRDKGVLAEALGAAFGGVLVSDFYGAYTSYDGRHQYCWAHLLRDVHDLATAHAKDAAVRGWADGVQRVYARARAVAAPDPAARRRAQRGFEREVYGLCAPYLDGKAPQAVLCRRIEACLTELFVFVVDPAVPPTNNAAERSLRHLVTSRKISGGTRSAAGTGTKMALATLFGTWRAQDLDPLAECRRLLAAPQV
jgi:transposase